MLNTQNIVIVFVVALAAAWRFNLLGRIAPQVVAATTPKWGLDGYSAAELGLAYQRALRREADTQIAQQLADANRAAAMRAYTDPFSGGGPAPASSSEQPPSPVA